jgi:hypothetical protein
MPLTEEEKKLRYEKAAARSVKIRGIRDRQAANRKAKLKEKTGA